MVCDKQLTLFGAILATLLCACIITSCGGGGGGGAKTLPALYEQPQGGVPNESPIDTGITEPPTAPGVESSSEEPGGIPRYEYGDEVHWFNPDTGQWIWIAEGYATITLDYWPGWIGEPPLDAKRLDTNFAKCATVQSLLERGFELLWIYGAVVGGEFKLPPDMTFAEAYERLPAEYEDILAVDPWSWGTLF